MKAGSCRARRTTASFTGANGASFLGGKTSNDTVGRPDERMSFIFTEILAFLAAIRGACLHKPADYSMDARDRTRDKSKSVGKAGICRGGVDKETGLYYTMRQGGGLWSATKKLTWRIRNPTIRMCRSVIPTSYLTVRIAGTTCVSTRGGRGFRSHVPSAESPCSFRFPTE